MNNIIKIKKNIFNDNRGNFIEIYNKSDKMLIDINFVKINCSTSKLGVIRGLHYQVGKFAQGKLIQVIQGKIYDVAVDIRFNSTTYGHWESNILDNKTQIFIPPGFAHGFLALEDSIIIYQCTENYNKVAERTIIWNDRSLNIKWPCKKPIISAKDRKGILFKDL